MKAKSLLAILLSAVMVVPTTVSAADLVAEEDLEPIEVAEPTAKDLLSPTSSGSLPQEFCLPTQTTRQSGGGLTMKPSLR